MRRNSAKPKSGGKDDLIPYMHTFFTSNLIQDASVPVPGQLEEVECGTAPIENFAREWFERFTVGLEAHNEGDVKRLAKGLMNCKDYAGSFNEDLVTPGIIFTDVNETLWTLTEDEQRTVVDRILDFKMRPDEPPVAAQFLCGKLYQEFGSLPRVAHGSMAASSVGFAPEIVSCARHFYDHNYDLSFALEHILQDKTHFLDTLGTKKRWPLAVLIGAFRPPSHLSSCRCIPLPPASSRPNHLMQT